MQLLQCSLSQHKLLEESHHHTVLCLAGDESAAQRTTGADRSLIRCHTCAVVPPWMLILFFCGIIVFCWHQSPLKVPFHAFAAVLLYFQIVWLIIDYCIPLVLLWVFWWEIFRPTWEDWLTIVSCLQCAHRAPENVFVFLEICFCWPSVCWKRKAVCLYFLSEHWVKLCHENWHNNCTVLGYSYHLSSSTFPQNRIILFPNNMFS